MRGEVDTAPEREKHNRPFDGQRIKISDAGIVCRKTAQRYRRHRVAKRVKPAHPCKMQRQKSRRRRHRIEEPQLFCHLRNARCHLAFFVHPRNFSLEELRSAHAQHRQNRYRQHDDTHAAQPVEHMPPKIYRRSQRVQTRHNRRARSRQPRHRLKKRIGKTDARDVDINRHRRHQRKRQPQHQNQRKPVARTQLAAEMEGHQPNRARGQRRCQSRVGKRRKRVVQKKIRHQCRYCEQH